MLLRVYRRIRRRMPAAAFWLFVLAAVSGALHLAMIASVRFADAFNGSAAAFFRAVFARLTNWIPFSLAETLILALPAIAAAVIILCVRCARKSGRRTLYAILGVLAVPAAVYSMFVWLFAAGYHASPLSEKLEIETRELSADELAQAASILAYNAGLSLDGVTFRYQDASVMPYDLDTLSGKLVEAYDRLEEDCPFLSRLSSRVKPIALSEPMTYTHISGMYTMFTGEANVNVNYPDYVVAYTAAHELAHQRGIARENEANFVAFLVCLASDDPYIRYSGFLNMYEYVSGALYSASPEYYGMVHGSLDARIRYELRAYSLFFDRYRDNTAARVSETVNDTYLKMQGTEGTRSYGMVVDLAVAYLLGTPRDAAGGK